MSTGLAKLSALACAAVMSGGAILGTAEAHPAHHAAAHAAKRHHHHHKRRHHSHRIPQHNGGDHDADNNGGPTDGDGNV